MKPRTIKAFSIAGLALIAAALAALFGFIILPASYDTRTLVYRQDDPLDIQPVRGQPIPPLDVAAALEPSADQLKTGKGLYSTYCATCHGTEGRGNGPAGAGLNPPPRNFAAEEGWKSGRGLSAVFETITNGLGGMPAFDYLTPQERFALAHYVQQFGNFPHPDRDDAAAYLDSKYRLSAGGQEPNKVSALFAEKRMIAEQRRAKLELEAVSSEEQLAVLRRAVADPARVAEFLSNLPDWRGNPDKLLLSAALGAPANGFYPDVARFAPAERSALQQALKTALAIQEEKKP